MPEILQEFPIAADRETVFPPLANPQVWIAGGP